MSKLISVVEGQTKRYVVRCNVGLDTEIGKQKQINKTFSTMEEAEEFVKKIESKLRLSYQEVMNQNKEAFVGVSFREFINEWFYGEYNLFVRPTTFRTRRVYIEKQVVPFFGDKIISDITEKDIRLFYHHLEEKGYAQSTITHIHGLLSTLFLAGLKRGIIKENPMGYIRFNRDQKEREPILWSQEERNRFLQIAEQENNDMMYDFALSSGIRLTEILVLTWSDIDFDKKTLSISKKLSLFSNQTQEKVEILKSGSHRLPLPSLLMVKLQMNKIQQEANKEELGDKYLHELDLVFPNRNGGFQKPSTVRLRLYKLIEKANVPRITFHDFRRMYAILLAQSGASILSIQRLLRYHSIESTFHLIGRYLPRKNVEFFGSTDEEINKVINSEE